MTTYKTFATATSAVFLTLVTAGTMPALAATLDDQQAPRGDVRATNSDIQAPRGQDTQAPATLDDAQAPRSAR